MSSSERSDSWSDVKIRPVLFWGLHSEPIRNKTKSPTSPSLVCTPENTEQNNEQKTGGAGDDGGGGASPQQQSGAVRVTWASFLLKPARKGWKFMLSKLMAVR